MRIIITGATGFIGRHLLDRLGGHEVIAITRESGRKIATTNNVSWLSMDLSAGIDLARLPGKADALIHLAQSDRYRDFPAGTEDVFQINVETPARLMRWAATAGVTRAVFTSTGTIYEPFTGPMVETSPVAPTGYYGSSKLAAETLTLPYQAVMAVSHLRLFFVYGLGQGNTMLARLMGNIAQGRPVTLPPTGDGLVFCPTHVTDVARAMVAACETGWTGVCNVAAPHAISMRELIDTIAAAVGRRPVIERVGAADPPPIVPDLSKLAGHIGIDAFLTAAQGVPLTLVQT